MFKAINELQRRNSRNKNRKQGFEDIHIVAKQLRPYVVNLGNLSFFENKKSISKTYYNLIFNFIIRKYKLRGGIERSST